MSVHVERNEQLYALLHTLNEYLIRAICAVLVSLDKVVAKSNDIVDRKLGGSVRIKHCRLIDSVLFLRSASYH